MYPVDDNVYEALRAPAREISGRISYKSEVTGQGEWLEPDGALIKFTIEKTSPNGKLFGFAVSQKITIEALGVLSGIKKGTNLMPFIYPKGFDVSSAGILPNFYVDTIEYNEVKNVTTIVGYDILHKFDSINIGSIEFTYPLYALNYALDIVEPFGAYCEFEGINHLITEAPNVDPTTSCRSVLAALAEFTGCICYVSHGNNIRFRFMQNEDFEDVIIPDDYFNLSLGEVIYLNKIASGTELGENISYGTDGFTQILWENPFLNSKSDAAQYLTNLGNIVLNLNSTNYSIEWRGSPSFEIGDYIIIQDKEGSAHYVRYFNETLEYNGGLKATSEWQSGDGDNIDTAPVSMGTVIKQTFAKVDKVSQEIELLAKKVEESDSAVLQEEVASLKMTTESITQEVSRTENAVDMLTNKVSNTVTADNLSILIEEELNNGVTGITTETGYVFNKEGLTICKSGSEMETKITEDGMTVYRNGSAMLTANCAGVDAVNLHASTYLIIGETSRFEDYDDPELGLRTGCFWISR